VCGTDWRLTVAGPSTVASLAGYAIDTTAAYPGRALSITGLIVGLALLATGRGRQPEAET
jgi:hypothetical protein